MIQVVIFCNLCWFFPPTDRWAPRPGHQGSIGQAWPENSSTLRIWRFCVCTALSFFTIQWYFCRGNQIWWSKRYKKSSRGEDFEKSSTANYFYQTFSSWEPHTSGSWLYDSTQKCFRTILCPGKCFHTIPVNVFTPTFRAEIYYQTMNVVTIQQSPKYSVSWSKILLQLVFLYLFRPNPYSEPWAGGSASTSVARLSWSLKSLSSWSTWLLHSFVDPVMERWTISSEIHVLNHFRRNFRKLDLWAEQIKQGTNKLALYIWTWIGHRKQKRQ